LFPSVSAAVAKIMPVEKIRWIGFGHIESDECGAMNQWLAAAPQAEIINGLTACGVSLQDLADRPPRALADGETIDIGTRRIRYIDTPHVPHGWEAGVLFEETTRTLLCGDLFTHIGNGPALVETDIVAPAMAAEDVFHATALTPSTATSIRKLAALKPTTLAVMHGSSYRGDGGKALHALADYYEKLLRAAVPAKVLTPA
jgi:flavorubredoxin